MMNKKPMLLMAGMAIVALLSAQTPGEVGLQSITTDLVRGQLEFLASDLLEGRETGTRGEYLAADYIASVFRMNGIKPFVEPDYLRSSGGPSRRGGAPGLYVPARTYFQTMNMVEFGPGDVQELSVISRSASGESSVDFSFRTDFSIRGGTVGRSATTQVVFAGYGYTNEKQGYDDYKKLDVRGKVVLILNGFPGHRNQQSEAYKKFMPEGRMAQYTMERDKAEYAAKLGAAAIIQVRPGQDPVADWAANQIYSYKGRFFEYDVPPAGDKRMTIPGDSLKEALPVFTVTGRVIQQLLDGTGVDLVQFEKTAAEKMTPASLLLPGKYIKFRTTVNSRIIRSRNVLGYIEGEKKNELVIIGAHYDHVGKTDGWVFNGADDNASGTVGVMAIARAVAATGKKPEKTIVFAAWSGEEKGLLGSRYFVSHLPDSVKVAVYLNYDMISRDEEGDTKGNKAEMTYTEAFPGLKEMTAKLIKEKNINLDMTYTSAKQPGGGSDHAPFAAVGIPIFYYMAAMHPDYHLPSDEVSKINWEKTTNIIRTGFLSVWELANGDKYLKP